MLNYILYTVHVPVQTDVHDVQVEFKVIVAWISYYYGMNRVLN